ncbi:MAG: 50S ribosomal protein L4 [Candidatus Micrarchaeaceae archaeon]
MNVDVALYNLEGKSAKSISLPEVFSGEYRADLLRRALLAEQSLKYQPQAHSVMAGLNTTAVYVGRYDANWRRGRHMGQAIRPRQALGGGAQGDVRRIPSATKGRRAHPHKLERKIVEQINRKEYILALRSAIAGCSKAEIVKANHSFNGSVPIVVEDAIESVTKTKELANILNSLGLGLELERSKGSSKRKGIRRNSKQRRFRKNILIIAAKSEKIAKAGGNIPGLDVCDVKSITVEKLAPGANPRVTIWSESATKAIENALEESSVGIKA